MANDEFVIKIGVDSDGAIHNLGELNKGGKGAKQSFKEVESASTKANAALIRAFTSLASKLAGVLTIAGFVRFVKNLAEAQLRLKNMSLTMGQSMKSLRALQMAFKSFGYSMSGADASVEAFTKSIADFKYGGELSGQAEAFSKLNVAVLDTTGKARDYYEVLVEGGESALRTMNGDTVEATMYLKHLGFSQEQITIMLDKNARTNMNKNKEVAAASENTADKVEEMNRKIIELQERFASLVLMIADRLQIFEMLNSLLHAISDWCSGEPSQAVIGFFKMIYAILDGIETMTIILINIGKKFSDFVLQPIMKFLDIIGEYVDNSNGGHYKSRMNWFGDGEDVYKKSYDSNGNVTSRNFYTPLDGSYGFVGGGSSGATGGGYSYGGGADVNGSGVGGGIGRDANESIWNYFEANEGRGYVFNGKNAYNCSMFTGAALTKMVNEHSDQFSADDKKLFAGQVSESQVVNIGNRVGFLDPSAALSDQNVKEGLLIGIDTGEHGFDRGRRYGIDHVLITARDRSGRVWILENSSHAGVHKSSPDQFRRYASRRVKRMYVVDVGRLMRGQGFNQQTQPAQQYSQVAQQNTNTPSMQSIPVRTIHITNNNDSRVSVNVNGGMNKITSATATARA